MNQTARIITESPVARFVVTLGALLLVALQLCAAALLYPLRAVRRARQARLDRRRMRTAAWVLRVTGDKRQPYQ
jgi:hypothetical protein